ncbi:MAG: hypothetical protein J6I46_01675 [Ruminococcus sp.]|nr:hypothetical protein [Ruminococcus sp.]
MGTNYTEKELKALNTKFEEPNKEVKCPRCGKFLVYKSVGNACEVKCETPNCLYDAIRGI